MSSTKKRSRKEFDGDIAIQNILNSIMDSNKTPSTKKRLKHNDNSPSIHMYECDVVFSSLDPVVNAKGIHQWEAVLKHSSDNKSAVLAKVSFAIIPMDKLSNFRNDLPSDIADSEYHCFMDYVFINSVEVHPDFSGYDYELCLIQRIIDTHSRIQNLIIIEYAHSMKAICEKMNFRPSQDPKYWIRYQENVQPSMSDFATCFRPDFEGQSISDALLRHYVEDTDNDVGGGVDEENKDSGSEEINESKDIDLSACFVSFSSRMNASNNQLEEDYTSCWSAKLECRPNDGGESVILATARFWCLHLQRLSPEDKNELIEALDAPCQELADLLPLMKLEDIDHGFGFDGMFKLTEEDKIDSLKLRLKSTINELLSNPNFDLNEEQLIQYLISRPLPLFENMNEGMGADITYLDRVEVKQGFKGRKFGRCLVEMIIRNTARAFDAVILKPYPLQWESKECETKEQKKEFESDKKRVVAVWESMWFSRFGGKDSLHWGRTQTMTHPKMEIEGNKITFKDPH